jgi:DUF971 family protein
MAATTLSLLDAQVIGEELATRWSDQSESYVRLEALRQKCPCAACAGEPDVTGKVLRPLVQYGPKSFQIRSLQIVGGYALQPTWQDGHNTGLYTFAYLRDLAT